MAKTKGPLLSLEAHGSLAKTLNYSQRKSGSQCRKYNKPLAAPTPAQRAQRRLTEFLVAQWQNMSAGDKATWTTNARTSGLNLSGYHYFLREAQRDLPTHHGLYGYWHFNEIVGGQVLDLSGRGNHGTLEPNYPSNTPTLINSRSNRFSKALLFDGSEDYVEMSAAANLFSGWTKATIILWVYSTLRGRALIGTLNLNVRGRSLSTGLYFRFVDTNANSIDSKQNAPFHSLNKWVQVIATYNEDDDYKVKIFTDGIEVPSYAYQNAGDSKLKVLDGYFRIGREDADYYKGGQDEVCIYNRALSAAEIATRYKFATKKI